MTRPSFSLTWLPPCSAAPAVHLALDYLLEHLPPQMHLLVGTRHDPPFSLARLRARGYLAELRAPDLRFTLAETTALLNDVLGLDLSPDDLARLQARTEGWPAALRLLADSLERISSPADRTAFIARLAHTDRHVFDFLAAEVLNRQPPDVRAFLLDTAILDELTPALCQAVTGRPDAPAILDDLYHRNLLVSVASPQSPVTNLQSTSLPTTNLPLSRHLCRIPAPAVGPRAAGAGGGAALPGRRGPGSAPGRH